MGDTAYCHKPVLFFSKETKVTRKILCFKKWIPITTSLNLTLFLQQLQFAMQHDPTVELLESFWDSNQSNLPRLL